MTQRIGKWDGCGQFQGCPAGNQQPEASPQILNASRVIWGPQTPPCRSGGDCTPPRTIVGWDRELPGPPHWQIPWSRTAPCGGAPSPPPGPPWSWAPFALSRLAALVPALAWSGGFPNIPQAPVPHAISGLHPSFLWPPMEVAPRQGPLSSHLPQISRA